MRTWMTSKSACISLELHFTIFNPLLTSKTKHKIWHLQVSPYIWKFDFYSIGVIFLLLCKFIAKIQGWFQRGYSEYNCAHNFWKSPCHVSHFHLHFKRIVGYLKDKRNCTDDLKFLTGPLKYQWVCQNCPYSNLKYLKSKKVVPLKYLFRNPFWIFPAKWLKYVYKCVL